MRDELKGIKKTLLAFFALFFLATVVICEWNAAHYPQQYQEPKIETEKYREEQNIQGSSPKDDQRIYSDVEHLKQGLQQTYQDIKRTGKDAAEAAKEKVQHKKRQQQNKQRVRHRGWKDKNELKRELGSNPKSPHYYEKENKYDEENLHHDDPYYSNHHHNHPHHHHHDHPYHHYPYHYGHHEDHDLEHAYHHYLHHGDYPPGFSERDIYEYLRRYPHDVPPHHDDHFPHQKYYGSDYDYDYKRRYRNPLYSEYNDILEDDERIRRRQYPYNYPENYYERPPYKKRETSFQDFEDPVETAQQAYESAVQEANEKIEQARQYGERFQDQLRRAKRGAGEEMKEASQTAKEKAQKAKEKASDIFQRGRQKVPNVREDAEAIYRGAEDKYEKGKHYMDKAYRGGRIKVDEAVQKGAEGVEQSAESVQGKAHDIREKAAQDERQKELENLLDPEEIKARAENKYHEAKEAAKSGIHSLREKASHVKEDVENRFQSKHKDEDVLAADTKPLGDYKEKLKSGVNKVFDTADKATESWQRTKEKTREKLKTGNK